jgi:hypothetical protein
MQALLSQACEMHDMDVFWVNETQTLYDAIDSQILAPLEARIAELEAQCKLVQVDEDEDLHDPINVGGEIHTMYSGTAFILVGYETEADCTHLPVGYCIAKVQP